MLVLYAIYDRVSGVYGEPFSCNKDDLALRRFNYLLDNAPMVAADCELYAVGTYDNEFGVISAFEKPKFIGKYEVKPNE